ncbi:uncharacterized protein (TIGR02687 family) [Trichococcus patagoniensis]|uniref:Uncharacterized protein (TIGR02687 family) n=1 Tax=Trichococcus patagoniensis TaxID=382641 RepID=A0A2T5IHL7_9LACT|nr:BREX-1 system phosphatase PglZ type A [Trichococcus patagoniensis]PTQ83311.1 uncharacterized protein (TIGR02687 family) [Trichococcus patagoniensis]
MMDMYEAEKRLQELFRQPLEDYQKRRIIFWYDKSQTFSDELGEYQLEDVLVLRCDEQHYFEMKYLVEYMHAEQNVLLYFEGERPENERNPLLDMYLYSQEFKMDPMENLKDELGITIETSDVFFRSYALFFNNKQRRKQFATVLAEKQGITEHDLELAVLCVLTKTKELHAFGVFRSLFTEYGIGQDNLWQQVIKFGRPDAFWHLAKLSFGYSQEERTVDTLVQAVFQTKLHAEFEGKVPANWEKQLLSQANNCVVFLNRWMNLRDEQASYNQLSDAVFEDLQIIKWMKNKPAKWLAQSDTFQAFDRQLVEGIALQLAEGAILFDEFEHIVLNRRSSYWFAAFADEYEALLAAIRLLKQVHLVEKEGFPYQKEAFWKKYEEHYYLLDSYYRQFYVAYDKGTGLFDAFASLRMTVENYYKNGFLAKLAETWMTFFKDATAFSVENTMKQERFYKDWISSYAAKENRIFVIISDALRYEVAVELGQQLEASTHYNVNLHALQGVVPSYTELGMASLLPHHQLSLSPNGDVLADGMGTKGLNQRNAVLQAKLDVDKAKAVDAKEVLNSSRSELREIFTGNGSVFYIYHNTIDAIGDHAASESHVFEAVELAQQELMRLIDKLFNGVSAVRFIVTADHGFLYTRDALHTLDKVTAERTDVIASNRRFFTNREADSQNQALLDFRVDVMAEEEVYVHIPKGASRLAIQGGGSNFVHGGILPQEVMIPVLDITTERGKEMHKSVDVQLISNTDRITNIVTYLDFLQVQAVSTERRARKLKMYFSDGMENLISNEVTLLADSPNEQASDRMVREKFVLMSQAYALLSEYYFVMIDLETGEEINRKKFVIDLPDAGLF